MNGALTLENCQVYLSRSHGHVGPDANRNKQWLQGGDTGGLVGRIEAGGSAEIQNSFAATTAAGVMSVGGLVGRVDGELSVTHSYADCYLTLEKGSQGIAGGLVGVGIDTATLALYGLFYHQIFAVTFDKSFSRATGLPVDRYNTLLAILTALTIVLGMRMMGAMLISSLVIFPALTAMRLFRSFRGVILCAAVTSVVCFMAGLTISFMFSTPVGATVVAADLAVFLCACLLAALRRR